MLSTVNSVLNSCLSGPKLLVSQFRNSLPICCTRKPKQQLLYSRTCYSRTFAHCNRFMAGTRIRVRYNLESASSFAGYFVYTTAAVCFVYSPNANLWQCFWSTEFVQLIPYSLYKGVTITGRAQYWMGKWHDEARV